MKAKKILAVVLLVAMIAALGTFTAFADDEEAAELYGLDVSFLRKDLNVADGVDISGFKTFTFNFAALPDSEGADSPAIDPQTVTVGAQSDDVATGAIALSDFITIDMFSHAGMYAWTVTEDQNTPAAPVLENVDVTAIRDSSSYTLRVYVINTDAGLAFDGITVQKGSDKVDPTETEEHQKSEFLFENTLKEVVGDDDHPALTVTKTISGSYGNKEKTFPITVNFEIPGNTEVALKDDVVANHDVTWADDTHGSVTANLSDGQSIVFTKLPAGTTFSVVEDQDSAYKSKTTGFVANPDENYVDEYTEMNGAGPILEADKTVSIDNQRDSMIPTGVIVDTLPYVLLVLVAAAGVVYLTLKKKANNA